MPKQKSEQIKETIEKVRKSKRNIKKVIEEIVKTEREYRDSLAHLKTFFKEVEKNRELCKKFGDVVVSDTLKIVESMEKISTSLLTELEKELKKLDSDEFLPLKDLREASKSVSKVLETHSQQMRDPYADYPGKMSKITAVIGTLAQSKQYEQFKSKFVKFLDKNDNVVKLRHDPSSYLIMPVQRVPRYRLLLESLGGELSKVKQYNESEEVVKSATQHIVETALTVNERTRWLEYLEKLSGKNQSDRTEARTLKFMVNRSKGSSSISDLKLASEQIKKLQHNDVARFEFVKGGTGSPTRIRAYLSGAGGKKYTFLVKATPEGFALTIKRDISKLKPEEVSKLFEVARKIGETISPQAKALVPPYSSPKQQAPQEKSTMPATLPPGAPKFISQRQNEPMPPKPAVQAPPSPSAPSSTPIQHLSSQQLPRVPVGFPYHPLTSARLVARVNSSPQAVKTSSPPEEPTQQSQVQTLPPPPLSLSEVELLRSLKRDKGSLINDEQIREIGRMKEEDSIRKLLKEYYDIVLKKPEPKSEEIAAAQEALQAAIRSKFEPKLGSSSPKR